MKIAIVTGASSGMGREMVFEIADRFGGIGEIWVIARREERLKEFEGKVPVPVRVFPLDLTAAGGLSLLEEALKEQKPDVKLLINAAGFGRVGTAEEIGWRTSSLMVRLNAEALTAVTELVLPYMSKNSRILQFASAAAFLPQPGFAVYAATKAYVLSYSWALNAELSGRGIFVTAVCPGPVDTEFFDGALQRGALGPYKRIFMAGAKKTVRKALKDGMAGKEISVPGISMKALFLLCRLVPHGILIKLMNRLVLPCKNNGE